jgi:hypothetical protein
LRIELLKTATAYGFNVALHDGDLSTAKELLELYEACLGPYAELQPDASSDRAWLDSLRLVIGQAEAGKVSREDTALVPSEVRAQLEGLEARTRSVELLGLEPMSEGDDGLLTVGSRLLGAVEDSLLLSLDPDPRREGVRVGPRDVCRLIATAREEGVWDFLRER